MSEKLASGHIVERLSENDNLRIQKYFQAFGNMIRLQPGGWFFEEAIIETLERIHSFKFKPTDVVIFTIPKSGTTWTQEIVWTFLHNPNLDNPDAKKPLEFRTRPIDGDLYLRLKNAPKPMIKTETALRNAIGKIDPDRVDDPLLMLTYTDLCLKDRRVIKSYCPISLYPKSFISTSKIVYVARDPMDVIICGFNYLQIFKPCKFIGSLDDFLDCFLNEEIFYCPYWLHLKEGWDLRDHPNVLFLQYEEMMANPFKEYSKINDFLGANLTDLQINNIIEYTNFTNMKKQKQEIKERGQLTDGGSWYNQYLKEKNGEYFRKGKTGAWKDILTPEQIARVTNWIKKCTEDFPKDFPYLCKE